MCFEMTNHYQGWDGRSFFEKAITPLWHGTGPIILVLRPKPRCYEEKVPSANALEKIGASTFVAIYGQDNSSQTNGALACHLETPRVRNFVIKIKYYE